MNSSLCDTHLCLVGRRQSQDAGLGHRQAALLVHTVGHDWPSPNDPESSDAHSGPKHCRRCFKRMLIQWHICVCPVALPRCLYDNKRRRIHACLHSLACKQCCNT